MEKKFNPKKLDKLNNPERLKMVPPGYIWDKLNLTGCETVVDIGAGTGLFSRAFINLMDNGTVYAADISGVMIDWMKENIVEDHIGIIPMMMGESEVPLEDELSDFVVMITLHHELKEPERLISEAFRLLKKGGPICIIDWKKEETPFGPALEIRCSKEEISNQISSSGFLKVNSDDSLDMFNMVWAEK